METFEKDEILKDMHIKMPTELLKVKYGSIELTPGSILTPTQVENEPALSWNAELGAFYTVEFNDLDAPSRADPKSREIHHWCVVNIPGSDVGSGEVLAEYIGSGPPKESQLHRYVFLVFKQTEKLEFKEQFVSNRSVEGRPNWSTVKFAAKYGLGDPVAGNFYQAEWDDYVPKLHEQIMKK